MSGDEKQLERLNAQAEILRRELQDGVEHTRERLKPANLKQEARDKAKASLDERSRQARDYISQHPVQILGAAAAVGALVAHRPLRRLLGTALALAASGYRSGLLRRSWRKRK